MIGLGIDDVKKIGKLEGNYIKEFMEDLMKGNLIQSRVWIDKMLKEGKDDRRLLIEIREYVIENIFEKIYIRKVLLELLQADIRLVNGVESCLVWDGLCCEFVK
mgnify:FL=1